MEKYNREWVPCFNGVTFEVTALLCAIKSLGVGPKMRWREQKTGESGRIKRFENKCKKERESTRDAEIE